MDKQETKYCQGCQAQLPLDARTCPYCQSRQLTRSEVRLDRMVHALLPKRSPATTCLIIGMADVDGLFKRVFDILCGHLCEFV